MSAHSEFDKELKRLLTELVNEALWPHSNSAIRRDDVIEWSIYIKQAVDKYVIPQPPLNALIQESLQQGRPQQAASYNGYKSAVDEARQSLWGTR